MKEKIRRIIRKLIYKNYFAYLLFLWLLLLPIGLTCEVFIEIAKITKGALQDCICLSSRRYFQENKNIN